MGWRIVVRRVLASTVGKYGHETMRAKYVKQQGEAYPKLYINRHSSNTSLLAGSSLFSD